LVDRLDFIPGFMAIQVQQHLFPARAHDTHWSRILHCDFFTTDTEGGTPNPGEITEAQLRLPASAFRHSHEKSTSRREADQVTLPAADGYPITGMRYATAGTTRANLVVAGAVGVPQRFYRRFAEFAAAAGYSTMTLDYRGVGLSAPIALDGFRMDYLDWGRLDLAAAVAAMSSPDVPLYVVGHSFGGHAFGMLPNHASVDGFYTFGTGAGWHGWMAPLEQIKVLAMWHVLGPLLTTWKGYLAWSLLGMGEDLPLDFYRQWKRWCRYPNYFFGDPSMWHLARGFARVRTPLMAANSIDDRWAPPKSRDAFIAGYRNAARQTLDIDPSRFGLRAIGHMGYFKSDAMPLWESALAWLDTCRSARSVVVSTGPDPSTRREPRRISAAGDAYGPA
jgi:predicted alpha/beta hydrolase